MKKIAINLVLIFISHVMLATDTNWTFLCKDNNNDYIAVGYGNDLGNVNFYCQKLNNSGGVIWQKEIGGADADIPYCIDTDGTNYYIGGITNSYGFGSPGDGYLVKLNSTGNLVWDVVLGEENTDEIRGLVVTGNQIIVAGNTNSFNPTKDIFISTFNANTGSQINTKILYFSNPIFEESVYLGELNDGNFLLIGDDGSDILLIKFDVNLNIIFSKELSNPDDIQGTSFTEDNSGNIYVTGFFNYFNSLKDLVIKVDNQGNIIWSKYFDSGNDSKALEIKYDANNGLLITGYTTAVPSGNTQCSAYLIEASGNLLFSKAFDNNVLLGSRNRWIESFSNNKYDLVNIAYANSFNDWNVELLSFSENSTSCDAVNLPLSISNANVSSANISLVSQNESFFSFSGGNISSINTFVNSTCEQTVYPYFEVDIDPCTGDVTTTNLTTNGTNYTWDFGDGINSNAFNPSHTYNGAGTYTITLFANDGNGNTDWFDVDVVISSPPAVSFNLPPSVANSTPVNLVGSPAGGTFSGNGVVFNAFNPSLVIPGLHTVTYTYTDANGCSGSTQQSILVFTISFNFVNYNLGTISPKLNNLVLQFSESNSAILSIYNLNGQIIQQINAADIRETFTRLSQELHSGNYVYILSDKQKIISGKILVAN